MESIRALEQAEPTQNQYREVLAALANRDRAYSDGDNVYDLYSSEPFTPLTISRRNLLVNESRLRANLPRTSTISPRTVEAVLNNDDIYFEEGTAHNSLTGREIASSSDLDTPDSAYRSHDILFARESQINDQSNVRILEEYFRNNRNAQCEYHPVIDKENNRLNIYDNTGRIIYQKEVLLGVNGDQNRRPFIPAGIHTYGEENSFLRFSPIRSSDIEQLAYLGNSNLDDNRVTNSAIALLESDLEHVQNTYLQNNCPFYVLPEEDDLRYSLSDGQLEFQANNISSSELENYNLTSVSEFTPRDIQINFNNESMENNISRSFANTLALRKPELMQNLNLSNSEYNELSKLAIAILGVESGFGTEGSYRVKEFEVGGVGLGQMLVTALKWNERADIALREDGVFSSEFVESFDTEGHENSRGLTQIKSPREYLREDYPDINENNLNDPANAAIATMYVLAEKYRALERISHSHPAIRESNKFEYLYTVYSGSTHRIQTRNATPRLNSKSAEIRAYVDNIEVLTR